MFGPFGVDLGGLWMALVGYFAGLGVPLGACCDQSLPKSEGTSNCRAFLDDFGSKMGAQDRTNNELRIDKKHVVFLDAFFGGFWAPGPLPSDSV